MPLTGTGEEMREKGRGWETSMVSAVAPVATQPLV
jgi:hypothetical protein